MKIVTKILLSIFSIATVSVFGILLLMLIIKTDHFFADYWIYFLVFTIILALFFLTYLFFTLFKFKKHKLFLGILNLISIIGLLIVVMPGLIVNIIFQNTDTSTSYFEIIPSSKYDLPFYDMRWWFALILYSLLLVTFILMLLLVLKYNRIVKKRKNKKIKKTDAKKQDVQNNNLNDLKKEAITFQNSLNISKKEIDYVEDINNIEEEFKTSSNQQQTNYFNQNVQKEKYLVPNTVHKTQNINEDREEKVNNYKPENYQQLLEEIKNHRNNMKETLNKSAVVSSIIPTNNTELQKPNQPVINEDINKMQIFIPNSSRYKDVDLYKIKEKIYYENIERKEYDKKTSEELQKKYSNSVPIGDVDKIWEAIRLKKQDNINNFKSNNSNNNNKK